MRVGCSMKDGVGPMVAVDAHRRRSFGNVAKFEDDGDVYTHRTGYLRQFLLDCVEREFRLFEQDQTCRMTPQNLAAQFAADRTSSTRDQDRLSDDRAAHQQLIRRSEEHPSELQP